MTYPTMIKLNANLLVSEEEVDGRPDFVIQRDGNTRRWHVNRSPFTYATATEAIKAVKNDCNNRHR